MFQTTIYILHIIYTILREDKNTVECFIYPGVFTVCLFYFATLQKPSWFI